MNKCSVDIFTITISGDYEIEKDNQNSNNYSFLSDET